MFERIRIEGSIERLAAQAAPHSRREGLATGLGHICDGDVQVYGATTFVVAITESGILDSDTAVKIAHELGWGETTGAEFRPEALNCAHYVRQVKQQQCQATHRRVTCAETQSKARHSARCLCGHGTCERRAANRCRKGHVQAPGIDPYAGTQLLHIARRIHQPANSEVQLCVKLCERVQMKLALAQDSVQRSQGRTVCRLVGPRCGAAANVDLRHSETAADAWALTPGVDAKFSGDLNPAELTTQLAHRDQARRELHFGRQLGRLSLHSKPQLLPSQSLNDQQVQLLAARFACQRMLDPGLLQDHTTPVDLEA